MVDVSIVIVNYKTFNLVEKCIESIKKFSSNFSYEVIVVDNSESEEEYEQLTKLQEDNIKIIDAKGNLGFGVANNLGVESSIGKYIHFLNSDTILMNNAIFELYEKINTIEKCGIVGSNLYNINGDPTHSFIDETLSIKQIKKEFSAFNLFIRKIKKKRKDFNYSNENKEVIGYVTGASLMISKEDFEKLGGFDSRIFMYAEESLLCKKLQIELNKKIYNVPDSKIIHLEGASDYEIYSQFKMNNFLKGNYIYYSTVYNEQYADKVIKTYQKVFSRLCFVGKILNKKTLVKNSSGYVNTIKNNKWK